MVAAAAGCLRVVCVCHMRHSSAYFACGMRYVMRFVAIPVSDHRASAQAGVDGLSALLSLATGEDDDDDRDDAEHDSGIADGADAPTREILVYLSRLSALGTARWAHALSVSTPHRSTPCRATVAQVHVCAGQGSLDGCACGPRWRRSGRDC